MRTLEQLSHACTEALAEADAKGATKAATFLRVDVRELFRELAHRKHDCRECEHAPTDQPITRRHEHG